jgi:hypothetical protein
MKSLPASILATLFGLVLLSAGTPVFAQGTGATGLILGPNGAVTNAPAAPATTPTQNQGATGLNLGQNGAVTNAPAAPAASTQAANANTLAGQTTGGTQPVPKTSRDPGTLNALLEWVVKIFADLVGVAGVALNVAAYYSIVKMGYLVGQLSALRTAWATFRDIGNIVILFGFIFFGISTILDNAGYNQKKMLVTLLIVAVAINFSSLASRIVIDGGNIVGIQFYKAFNNGNIPDDSIGVAAISNNGPSNALMNSVRLTTLYGDSIQNGTDFTGNYPLIAFLSIILFTVIAFVFFSIAFLLVARFVILVFLITVSPLAFAGFVIPAFTPKSREWVTALINNSIVAPVVLLLLLVSTKIVTSPTFINILSGSSWSSASGGTLGADPGSVTRNAAIIVVFMIACGFYVASLIVAKQLSAFGAGAVMNVGQNVTKRLRGGSTSVARRAGSIATAPARALSGLAGRKLVTPVRQTIGRGVRAAGIALPWGTGIVGQNMIDNAKKAQYGSGYSVDSLAAERKKVKNAAETDARKAKIKKDLAEAQDLRKNAGSQKISKTQTIRLRRRLAKCLRKKLKNWKALRKRTRRWFRTLARNSSSRSWKARKRPKILRPRLVLRASREWATWSRKPPISAMPVMQRCRKILAKPLRRLLNKDLQFADPSFLENPLVAQNLTDKQYDELVKRW